MFVGKFIQKLPAEFHETVWKGGAWVKKKNLDLHQFP